jgi:hypothetical protein
MKTLRSVLILDAAVLFVLGLLFVFAPHQVAAAFHFENLPPGVNYLIGLWGCALATLAVGYCVAATDPVRHVVWLQVGIARGALECLLGVVYVARGVVTFQQAAVGIIAAAVITVAYILSYPRWQLEVAV